jgi:hypothetical protein
VFLPEKADERPRQWAYISDYDVRLTTLEEARKGKAYMVMYRPSR